MLMSHYRPAREWPPEPALAPTPALASASAARPRGIRGRRGVTLIEMIVVIGLLVLMMSIVVTIFQYSTTAVTTAQVNQELDQQLRRLDTMIRTDLQGITARMTPPLNPLDGLGYFTIIENQFSDPQGEDSDDCVAFTARAPAGQPFTGRIWVQFPDLPVQVVATPTLANQDVSTAAQQLTMPMTITSEYAEIIYFQRGENLYRRVLLIAPQLKDTTAFANRGLGLPHNVGWSGVAAGELAFRSATLGMFEPGVNPPRPVAMSWQGVNDISSHPGSGLAPPPVNNPTANVVPVPNSLGDLTNRQNRFSHPRHAADFVTFNADGSTTVLPDGIDDDANNDGLADFAPTLYPQVFGKPARWSNGAVIAGELLAAVPAPTGANSDSLAFPYIFPGMYSQVNLASGVLAPVTSGAQPLGAIHGMPLLGAGVINHAPILSGDSVVAPSTLPADNQLESWWGFPTWRETMSSSWLDPLWRLNDSSNFSGGAPAQAPGLSRGANFRALPPLSTSSLATPTFSDGLGYTGAGNFAMPAAVWQDDLIATGVRSFDIKVYDPNVKYFDTGTGVFQYGASYVDLGYATTLLPPIAAPITDPVVLNFRSRALETFGHEGRIPPLLGDVRVDPNWPTQNVGDDDTAVNRLRRVFDTWSTDYSNVPSRKFNQPPGGARPSLPSYPAPYTQPLTGIQIQIRIVNPRNDRLKTLTIRQDFSDKL